METLYTLFCTQLFFQPLLGRRMCFSFPTRSSRGYLFLDKLKSITLSKETDEVRENSASQTQSADAGILAHDKNNRFLLGKQPRCHLDYWNTHYSTDLEMIHQKGKRVFGMAQKGSLPGGLKGRHSRFHSVSSSQSDQQPFHRQLCHWTVFSCPLPGAKERGTNFISILRPFWKQSQGVEDVIFHCQAWRAIEKGRKTRQIRQSV